MEVGRTKSRHISSDVEAGKLKDDAIALIRQGQWATALALFIRLSDAGFLDAAYTVASIYERGPGDVQMDLEKAETWYRQAISEADDPEARFDLARLILKRARESQESCDTDRIAYALHLLDDLVNNADPYAALYLAAACVEGRFVPKDLQRAESLFAKAADQGFAIAFIELSRLAFQAGRFVLGLRLRLKALAIVLPLIFRNRHDRRLFLMHPGDPTDSEEFPGWYRSGDWLRFG